MKQYYTNQPRLVLFCSSLALLSLCEIGVLGVKTDQETLLPYFLLSFYFFFIGGNIF